MMPSLSRPVDVERLRLKLADALRGLDTEGAAEGAALVRRAKGAKDRRAAEAAQLELRSFCVRHELSDVLAAAGLPHPYVFRRRFADNRRPADEAPPNRSEHGQPGWKLLGVDVGYPIGVPASALTANAEWVDYFSRYGFNIFTLKSVRKEARDELPFPNWVYLQNLDQPLPLGTQADEVVAFGNQSTYLPRPASYSTANSFGVPSAEPSEWAEEIRKIKGALRADQLLIVSVMGTPEDNDGQDFVTDFVDVARMAANADAPAIELNLSCPNKLADTGEMMRPICEDPETTIAIVEAVYDAVGTTIPLVAKLGYLTREQLAVLLPRLVPFVRGISGINTLQVRVVDPETGEPTFRGVDRNGQEVMREAAGLSGVALRYFALDFVQSLNHLRQVNDGWDFDIIAMGGVMDAHDVRALMAAGADCVQAATAAATNPALPLELRDAGVTAGRQDVDEIREAVLAADGSLRSIEDVALRLDIEPDGVSTLFASPYDLPRFVAELIWLRRKARQQPGSQVDASRQNGKAYRDASTINAALKEVYERRALDASLGLGEAASRLGLSESGVEMLISERQLSAVGVGAATRIPTWQLAEDTPTTILEGAPEVTRIFAGSPIALAGWMEAVNPALGTTPLAALETGHVDRVLAACAAIGAAGR